MKNITKIERGRVSFLYTKIVEEWNRGIIKRVIV